MRNFTSGKWKYREIFGTIYSGKTVIAKVFDAEEPFKVTPEGQANARLLVAAPKMYDTLYETLQLLKGKSSPDGDEFARTTENIQELLDRVDNQEDPELIAQRPLIPFEGNGGAINPQNPFSSQVVLQIHR